VYAELALPFEAPARPAGEPADRDLVEEVRAAFRVFVRDADLARTPLAERLIGTGGSISARAGEVRRLLAVAIADAWPDARSEERLVLEQSYLGAGGTLHVSRSTRYRLLRRSLDAVAASLAHQSVASSSPPST